MNCSDLDDVLIATGEYPAAPLPFRAEEHLRGCTRCRGLVNALNPPYPEEASSAAKLREIEQRMAEGLRPVRPLPPSRCFFAAFLGIFVLVTGAGVYWMGVSALAAMSRLQAGVTLCAVATSAGLLAHSLARQTVPGSRHWIPPGRLLPLVVLALVLVVAVLFKFHPERHFLAKSWGCLRSGGAVALLAAGPFWLMVRRGAVLSPALTGAATGGLAGLVGTAALEIHCPNLHAMHILASHVGVAVLGGVAGLVAGLAVEFGRRHRA